jgi:lysophospholipase L1-like esterase
MPTSRSGLQWFWIFLLAILPAWGGTLPPQVHLTADQDHQRLLTLLHIPSLRRGPDGDPTSPNAANFDESRVPANLNLPDPLLLNDGERVSSPELWFERRRPEIVEAFDGEIYGRVPKQTPRVNWQIISSTREEIRGMPVTTRKLVGHVDNASYPLIHIEIQLTLTTPAKAIGPVPLILELGLSSEEREAILKRIPEAQRAAFLGSNPAWQQQVLAKGWGFAILIPTSVQADNGAGLTDGIIGLLNEGQPRRLDDWGALRAWAWGASRALDYFETDPSIDARQVGIEGLSRYGKAALVAMAYDQRFAIGFIASSGAGGAKLLRRNFGEQVENLASPAEYQWMAGNFLKYAGPLTPKDLPVDAHELIALCAPRPVFISSGSQQVEGGWVDAKGMFLGAVGAGPVYRLLGKNDLGTAAFPPIETSLIDGDLAFRQHSGGHTIGPNWPAFLTFAGRYLKGPTAETSSDSAVWVGTWASSPQLSDSSVNPPTPELTDVTLRQVVHVSLGGTRLRVRFSNEFGKTSLTILAAHVAKVARNAAIEETSDQPLTFNKQSSVTISPGAPMFSDPVPFDLPSLSDLAITMHVKGPPDGVTTHAGSRATSYFTHGDAVSEVVLPSVQTIDHWYFLSGVDVGADSSRPGSIVVLGDSITDGRNSTTNGNGRWPDVLARRLQLNPQTRDIAVLNEGIGGNRLLHDGLGPNALSRLDRDVLAQAGVHWLVILEGVNDIGTCTKDCDLDTTVRQMIAAYRQIVLRAHAHQIRVFAATILPFGGSFYSSPQAEVARQTVNQWIRTSGAFDAVLDFDALTRDPQNPSNLSPAADSGDHLHPADAGYKVMGDSIDLKIFAK